MPLTNRERFHACMNFQPLDRLPVIEPFNWWDLTLDRWYSEGLPKDIDLARFFGLDPHHQTWIGPGPNENPDRPDGMWDVDSFDAYEKVKKHLYPENAFDSIKLRKIKPDHESGRIFTWITVEGFFWFPRVLFGIERHLTAFYEHPELMHAINSDLLQYNKRVISEFCSNMVPDWMTIAEDMSFNTGPMIGHDLINEFMRPYYLDLINHVRECGISFIFIDTDGNHWDIISLFHEEIGIDGFVPFERNAGMDLNIAREKYPKLRIIGGYNKRAMFGSEGDVVREFEQALPALKSGGIIPGCDHQTPPQVSLEQYQQYIEHLKHYAKLAAI
jgi:hypothetical protein